MGYLSKSTPQGTFVTQIHIRFGENRTVDGYGRQDLINIEK